MWNTSTIERRVSGLSIHAIDRLEVEKSPMVGRAPHDELRMSVDHWLAATSCLSLAP